MPGECLFFSWLASPFCCKLIVSFTSAPSPHLALMCLLRQYSVPPLTLFCSHAHPFMPHRSSFCVPPLILSCPSVHPPNISTGSAFVPLLIQYWSGIDSVSIGARLNRTLIEHQSNTNRTPIEQWPVAGGNHMVGGRRVSVPLHSQEFEN